jgi:hypothetical protein
MSELYSTVEPHLIRAARGIANDLESAGFKYQVNINRSETVHPDSLQFDVKVITSGMQTAGERRERRVRIIKTHLISCIKTFVISVIAITIFCAITRLR